LLFGYASITFAITFYRTELMGTPVKPYKESDLGKKEQVAEMFDNISPKPLPFNGNRYSMEKESCKNHKRIGS